MDFEFNSKEPIYIQIKKYIQMRIVSGELKGGDKLQSVREYATQLKVNPNTIQRVYGELEDDGLIMTQRGIGKFVTEDEGTIKNLRKDTSREVLKDFIKNTKGLGLTKDEIFEMINEMYEEV